MKIGNKEFDTAKHTYIMGILNVTQDTSRLRQKKKLQELRRLSRLSKRILMCRFRLILIRVMWQRQHFRQGQIW